MAAVALSFLINIYFHVEDKKTAHRRQIREEFIATTLANMNVGTGALGHMYVPLVNSDLIPRLRSGACVF